MQPVPCLYPHAAHGQQQMLLLEGMAACVAAQTAGRRVISAHCHTGQLRITTVSTKPINPDPEDTHHD